jgi:Na+-driven multidrug efflux pump
MMNRSWQNATAQTPSGFGMPISGVTYGIGLGMNTGTTVCIAPASVVRDRHIAGAVLADATRPGTTSWSPPTC